MNAPGTERNDALDFTKGVLVLLMVVYHWGNYFLGAVPYFYDYLRFLTPSFIFITGLIIGMIYIGKYDLSDGRVYQRLVLRGVKVLILFSLLNLIIHSAGLGRRSPQGFGAAGYLADWWDIYVTGSSPVAAFRVLVAIGYTLIFAALWLWLSRFARGFLIVCAVLLVFLIQLGEIKGAAFDNATLFSFGVLGLACGFLGLPRLMAAARQLTILAPLYVGYLLLMTFAGPQYWVQIIGVLLSVTFILGVGQSRLASNPAGRVISEIGRFSLVAYIGQIAILQVLKAAAKWVGESAVIHGLCLAAACAFTVLLVLGLAAATRRSPVTKACYKFAFA